MGGKRLNRNYGRIGHMLLVALIPFYMNQNFCPKLWEARRTNDPVKVEAVIKEHLERNQPVEPFSFLDKEITKCGYDINKGQ